MTMDVVALPKERADDVRRFLRVHHGENFYGARAAYFRWLFEDIPCDWFEPFRRQGQLPVNALLDDAGAIVGVHTFAPFDAVTPWNGTAGIWDVNWISTVSGGGRRLAAHLLERVDLYAGFGCNELSAAAFRRMGLAVVPEIHRSLFVLDRKTVDSLLRGLDGGADAMAPEQVDGTRLLSGSELTGTKAIPESAIEETCAQITVGVSRDPRWLKWRYDAHPEIAYHVVAPGPDDPRGAVVLRMERVTGSRTSVCRLMEIIGAFEHFPDLLRVGLGFAAANGAALADFFTPSRSFADAVDRSARSASLELAINPRIPYKFQPAAYDPANAPNMVLSVGGKAPEACRMEDFFATKGDSNQDILRQH